ncbi:VIT1/CCC1 transporter family protein [Roseococcus sp. YIM B11640]|uniref:VIT1/CCC1 transporter family protein n=1 Tax=Roseococcus sp. YIM B11640 TaxID=3133973 RepID=UPI003C7A2149
MRHQERHFVDRIGWLRAAVLGANDGIVSTASLIVGVAAAGTPRAGILVAGFAGLVAGATSMAAGEYVSVSSQSDSERAETERERAELAADPGFEREELSRIYQERGLEPGLAGQVADALMRKDALAAHMRDELGISEVTQARPIQAALASAASFSIGAALPLGTAMAVPLAWVGPSVSAASLAFLALLGAIGAWTGGASAPRAAWRVAFWGALALGLTALIGRLVGQAV